MTVNVYYADDYKIQEGGGIIKKKKTGLLSLSVNTDANT